MNLSTYFLHGLDSSGHGTKGQFFAKNYPFVKSPNFTGTLENRLLQLDALCENETDITFIGSSFGGLMAACYAAQYPSQVANLILLAPALNFPEYRVPEKKLEVPALLVIGDADDVTPIDPVVMQAKKTFSHLRIEIVKDDHFLHNSFTTLDWHGLLTRGVILEVVRE